MVLSYCFLVIGLRNGIGRQEGDRISYFRTYAHQYYTTIYVTWRCEKVLIHGKLRPSNVRWKFCGDIYTEKTTRIHDQTPMVEVTDVRYTEITRILDFAIKSNSNLRDKLYRDLG